MSNTIGSELYAPLFSALHMGILGASQGYSSAMPEFDYLVMLGSSTTAEVYSNNTVLGRQEQSTRKSSAGLGFDIPIMGRGSGGSTIADLDANVDAYLAALGPISAENPSRVAVIVNIGSNDIGVTDYDAMLQATKDTMLAGLNSIITKITAFGFTPILSTSNSRKGVELVYQEWAEKFYNPAIAARTPYWYNPPAVLDYSQFYFDNKDVVNWWQGDNVHPWMATVPMQQHTVAQIATKAVLPPISTTERVIICFTAVTRIGGMTHIAGGASGSSSEVVDTRGNLISGATFAYSGASGSTANTRPNPGAWNVDLANNVVQGSSLFKSGTMTFAANYGVGYANRTGTLRITANSSTAGRSTRFTVGAGSVVVNQSAAGVQIGETPFALDASGVLVFTAAAETGGTAQVSGVEFVFS